MADQLRTFLSVEDYNLVGHFERLRKTLLEEKADDRLERPLAFWALASDRRLPFAFLGRTLNDLLSTPFEELLATPGVGQKKICSLITLLSRATKDAPPEDPFGLDAIDETRQTGRGLDRSPTDGAQFNPAMVSEALWVQWRNTVKRLGLGTLKLGRLTPTLQALPTVIWHTPLAEYVDLSLSDIRQLKTHGEKRVRAILEVFWVLHEALGGAHVKDHLEVVLMPKFVPRVESWLAATLADGKSPTPQGIRTSLAGPLLAQIEIDAGPTVWRPAADRLGLKGSPKSVRQLAKRMGVTRARVYQLLEECGKVMAVRWPEGEHLLVALGERMRSLSARPDMIRSFDTLVGLFFPKSSHALRPVADRFRGVVAAVAD
ncbi:MAG: hypothetical protein A2W31_06910 [Planctomycetes bacterium RBG_16_64_10]|nr:MAG: hypothetical protein A2W31_06910 [Planctomycetes bacterium RBG_16_64_10]